MEKPANANMRKAIIDLGTNTFQLLVVEQEGQDFHIIHEDSYAAKIGQGGISKGIITQEGIERAIAGLNYFKTILEKEGVAPDIFVKNTFEDRLSNKDPQLARAVAEIMKDLK